MLNSTTLAGNPENMPTIEPVAITLEMYYFGPEKKNKLGLPPQMNFAHLVLTDHFQKCVLSLDEHAQFPGKKWLRHIEK